MYCGDETGSFVGEIGTRNSKFGYGGQDAPGLVTPSYVILDGSVDDGGGTRRRPAAVPSCCYHRRWSERDLRTPLRTIERPDSVDPGDFLAQGDSIQDWDAWEALWRHSFDVMRTKDHFKHTSPAAAAAGSGSSANNNNNNNNNGTTNKKRLVVGNLKTDNESTSTLDAVKPASSTLTGGSGTTATSASLSSSPSVYDSRVTHPILVVAPGYTYSMTGSSSSQAQQAQQQKQLVEMTERMMESLETGALFIAPASMLAAFCHGRQTATVVDIGASHCTVTPVVDGLLLYNAQRRNGRGGDWLGNVQYRALTNMMTNNTPPKDKDRNAAAAVILLRYQVGVRNNNTVVSTAPVNPIFHRWALQDLMYEMRTSGIMHLSPLSTAPATVPLFRDLYYDGGDAMEVDGGGGGGGASSPLPALPHSGGGNTHYELPDGTVVDLTTTQTGRDLCRLPELWFADTTPFLNDGGGHDDDHNNPIYNEHATLSAAPLHKLVHESLSAVADIDVRKDLASQIILTGSGSLTPHLDRRLSYELAKLCKSRVIYNKHPIERQCAAWIGGSILTSLGSFQQLWLSRAEYDEYGAYLAAQRFPLS